jgi:hypothetical protein
MPVRSVARSASVREQEQPSRARFPQLACLAARGRLAAGSRCLRSARARRPSKGRASLPFLAPLSLRAPTHARFARSAFEFNPLRASITFEQASQTGRALLIGSAEFLSLGQADRLQVVPVSRSSPVCRASGQACRWQTAPSGGLSQNPMANLSVKGTGLRPAPYVER